jgi:restriction system protein
MARRRRRRASNTQAWIVLAIFAVLALAFLARYPWVAAVLAVLAGAWIYWRRWGRPRRHAATARAQAAIAEQIEREREEVARRDLRERSVNLGGLLALTAREFEVRVGDILLDHGYDEIEHVGRSGDLGIDLFATDDSGERVGIQCKRYAPDKLVGAPEVRLLYGDLTHASVRGVFVTTSGYTADAIAYAESHGITLIDGSRLAKLAAATVPEGVGIEEATGGGMK